MYDKHDRRVSKYWQQSPMKGKLITVSIKQHVHDVPIFCHWIMASNKQLVIIIKLIRVYNINMYECRIHVQLTRIKAYNTTGVHSVHKPEGEWKHGLFTCFKSTGAAENLQYAYKLINSFILPFK